MGAFQPLHWVLVAVVALLLFGGRGKLSGLMGDAAKGIRAFRDGMKEDPAVADKTIASTENAKDETRS